MEDVLIVPIIIPTLVLKLMLVFFAHKIVSISPALSNVFIILMSPILIISLRLFKLKIKHQRSIGLKFNKAKNWVHGKLVLLINLSLLMDIVKAVHNTHLISFQQINLVGLVITIMKISILALLDQIDIQTYPTTNG